MRNTNCRLGAIMIASSLLGFSVQHAAGQQRPAPLQRLKGTWDMECKFKEVTFDGRVYSESAWTCDGTNIKINETVPGNISFHFTPRTSWPSKEAWQQYKDQIGDHVFTLRKATGASGYLLTIETRKGKDVDNLALSYSEADGFRSQATPEAQADKRPVATIKFSEAGGHMWEIEGQWNIHFKPSASKKIQVP